MTTVGSKTPVSILHEYLVGRGYTPKFDLIYNGSGNQVPTFAYKVEHNGFSSVGWGRSKQEAKHDAAKKMLEYLDTYEEEKYKGEVKQVVVPHENNISYNAIGNLGDYCKKNMYPEAIFYCISEVGPPHAKIFTLKCCVSQLSTIAEARTKKQAKQIAAHKMIMQLQEEAGERPLAVAVVKSPKDENSSVSFGMPAGQGQVALYKDYCNAYVGMEEKSETLSKIVQKELVPTLENSLELVKTIAEELGAGIEMNCISPTGRLYSDLLDGEKNLVLIKDDETIVQVKQKDVIISLYMLILKVNPPIAAAGEERTVAAKSMIEDLIIFVT